VSYDLIFIPRAAGQSWDEAIEASEDAADTGPRLADAPWRNIVAAAGRLFGEVTDDSGKDVRELEHPESGLDLTAWTDEASIGLPYQHTGEAARSYLKAMFDLAAVVAKESGLHGYDLQIDRPLDESDDYFDEVLEIYTNTSEGNVDQAE
jgi:hypothetical protein